MINIEVIFKERKIKKENLQETNTDICLKKTGSTMMYDDRYPIIFSMIKQRNGCKILHRI